MNKLFKSKKGYLMRIMFLLIIIFSAYIAFWYIPQAEKEAIEKGEVCNEFTSAWGTEYICCVDCKELGFEYLKYEYSGSFFGASVSNCYCKDGNEPKQIW